MNQPESNAEKSGATFRADSGGSANFARFTVTHPVFTTMIMLIFVILGLFTLQRLNIDLMPELSFPALTIVTEYENTSPSEIEELITRPIEEVVATITGLEVIESVSQEGMSLVTASFIWGSDLDVVSNDIRDGLDRIADLLPDEADRSIMLKYNTSIFPVAILGVGSSLNPIELRQLIDEQIKPRIERLPGVAALNIWGGLEREIQVRLDFNRIKSLHLTIDEIRNALRGANLTLPVGPIDEANYQVNLRVPGRFTSLQQLRDTVITYRDNAPIQLKQVAEVIDTHRKISRKALVNGVPGVQLMVRKESGKNTVAVTSKVMAEIDKIQKELPQIQIVSVIDTGEYIQRAIDNLNQSMFFGAGMAFLVLLFFLRDLRAALLVGVAIPISVIATFTLIYFSGYTLNLMTLGGLALGIGLMVDNAIVVQESIIRLRDEHHLDARESAIAGTGQVAVAIIGSTLTTVAIFLPLIFAQGLAGEMFSQLGIVVSFALFASLGVALAFSPMLAARFLKADISIHASKSNQPKGYFHRISNWSGNSIDQLENYYTNLLQGSLQHPWRSLGTVGLILAATAGLYPIIGAEFMPPSDESEVRVQFDMEEGTRLEVVEKKMLEISERVINYLPEIKNYVTTIGPSLFQLDTGARGEMRVALMPVVERNRSSVEIANDLRNELSDVPGGLLRVRAPEDIMMEMIGGGEPLTIEITGYDLDVLSSLAAETERLMLKVPSITDVKIDRQAGVPEALLHIDRERAADLGISVVQIARTLETAIGGTEESLYRDQGDEYRILLRLKDAHQMEIDDILDLTVMNSMGMQVTLRTVISVEPGIGPVTIKRKNQERIIRIGANISGADLGSVAAEVQEALKQLPMPAGYRISIGGEFEELQKAFRDLATVMILGVILVYMIMASLFESYLDPLVVMFSVPLAVIGINVVLLVTGTSYNVVSLIGCIILIGLVVNNAILLMEQTNHLRRNEAFNIQSALVEAGRQRLRPILMTALTTILAMLPMAMAKGEGAAIQSSMARAVIGGLLSSTMITLIVIPIIYRLVHRRDVLEQA